MPWMRLEVMVGKRNQPQIPGVSHELTDMNWPEKADDR